MTGSAQDASHQSLVCTVCTMPISLETSKTDENGKAVHEECYVRKTISQFRRGGQIHLLADWFASIGGERYANHRLVTRGRAAIEAGHSSEVANLPLVGQPIG